jgi:hypothetical protein
MVLQSNGYGVMLLLTHLLVLAPVYRVTDMVLRSNVCDVKE